MAGGESTSDEAAEPVVAAPAQDGPAEPQPAASPAPTTAAPAAAADDDSGGSDNARIVFAPKQAWFLRPPPSETVRKQEEAARKAAVKKAERDAGVHGSGGRDTKNGPLRLPSGTTLGAGGKIIKLALPPPATATVSAGATASKGQGDGGGKAPARAGAPPVLGDRSSSDAATPSSERNDAAAAEPIGQGDKEEGGDGEVEVCKDCEAGGDARTAEGGKAQVFDSRWRGGCSINGWLHIFEHFPACLYCGS